MAEHFKLVVTPKGTQIVTFTGVDEDFAQKYGDTLAYAKMLAGDDGNNNEPVLDVKNPEPLTIEYVFSQTSSEPSIKHKKCLRKNQSILFIQSCS